MKYEKLVEKNNELIKEISNVKNKHSQAVNNEKKALQNFEDTKLEVRTLQHQNGELKKLQNQHEKLAEEFDKIKNLEKQILGIVTVILKLKTSLESFQNTYLN